MGRIMSKCEAAEFLGIRLSELRKLMKKKEIPYKALDHKERKALFKKSDLVKWSKAQKIRKLK